jgi:anti-anti-sigma factor
MKTNPVKQAIIRACVDSEFREHLINDPRKALAEEGIEVPSGIEIKVHESTDDKIMIVLPGPEVKKLQEQIAQMPSGPVSDIPETLSLTWSPQTLTAVGRIDSVTAPYLRRELQKAFTDLDLNMAGITYMSSAGLSALLSGYKHLAGHDAKLYLIDATEEVKNVLELAGFLELLEIVDASDTSNPAVNPWAGMITFAF